MPDIIYNHPFYTVAICVVIIMTIMTYDLFFNKHDHHDHKHPHH